MPLRFKASSRICIVFISQLVCKFHSGSPLVGSLSCGVSVLSPIEPALCYDSVSSFDNGYD